MIMCRLTHDYLQDWLAKFIWRRLDLVWIKEWQHVWSASSTYIDCRAWIQHALWSCLETSKRVKDCAWAMTLTDNPVPYISDYFQALYTAQRSLCPVATESPPPSFLSYTCMTAWMLSTCMMKDLNLNEPKILQLTWLASPWLLICLRSAADSSFSSTTSQLDQPLPFSSIQPKYFMPTLISGINWVYGRQSNESLLKWRGPLPAAFAWEEMLGGFCCSSSADPTFAARELIAWVQQSRQDNRDRTALSIWLYNSNMMTQPTMLMINRTRELVQMLGFWAQLDSCCYSL